MDFIEYLSNIYLTLTDMIHELNSDATDLLNKYGGI